MENFNLKKFLVENKLTTNSKLLEAERAVPTPEEAAALATKAVGRLENDPDINKAADAIAKNPKALEQLKNVLAKAGINPTELSETINRAVVQKLALVMAKKSQEVAEGADYGGPIFLGLVGGGVLGSILDSVGDVVYSAHNIIMGAPNPSHMTAIVLGAAAGAVLAAIAKKVFDGMS